VVEVGEQIGGDFFGHLAGDEVTAGNAGATGPCPLAFGLE
jgi:hypothetical protein